MLQKLLDLLKLESFRPHQEIAIQSNIQDQKDAVICTHIDYHNQHESAALIGLFHTTSSVLTSVESYLNYRNRRREEYRGNAPLCSGEYIEASTRGFNNFLRNTTSIMITSKNDQILNEHNVNIIINITWLLRFVKKFDLYKSM